MFLTLHGSSLTQENTGQSELKTTTTTKTPPPAPHPSEGSLGLWSSRVTVLDASDEARHRKWEGPKARKENQNPFRPQARLEVPPLPTPPPPWPCGPGWPQVAEGTQTVLRKAP